MRHSAPYHTARSSFQLSPSPAQDSPLSTRLHQFQIQIQHLIGSSLVFLSGEQISLLRLLFFILFPHFAFSFPCFSFVSDCNQLEPFFFFSHNKPKADFGFTRVIMSRRQVNPSRRFVDSGSIPFAGALHSKSRSSPLLSIGLVLLGAFLLVAYSYSGAGLFGGEKEAFSKFEGDFSCTLEVQRAIPILKKAYGDSMRKVLHVGPDTCSVVSKLLKEEETEGWGVEPYDIEDADGNCKSLVRKGIVRVADIKFPLPYRPKSFSLVIVSDALDYLSPKYLNKTLPDLARVSSDGLVIFAGLPGQQKAKVAELSKFGRPAKMRSSSWWIRYFVQTSLEENEAAIKKFDQAAVKKSYKPACQVFHLNSYH